MQPATRHDIALLFARCLALFALYEPFLTVCSFVSGALITVLFGTGHVAAVPSDPLWLTAFLHLALTRLIAFTVLWLLAPRVASWISTVRHPSPKIYAAGDVAGTPWAANPGHTSK